MAKKKPVQQVAVPQRTLPEIQSEYADLCTQGGDRQYKVEVLKGELNNINQRLLQLNQEAAALPKEAPEAK
jgi:hypothetical protein